MTFPRAGVSASIQMSSVPVGSRSVSGALPLKIAKRIRGECCYPGCSDLALDDSDHCAPHDAHEKGRYRSKARRRRQRLADAGLCIVSSCGKKVTKRRRKDGTIELRRCQACTKALRTTARERRSVSGAPCSVSVSPVETRRDRVAKRLIPWENSPQNEGRTRLRGGKRGAPSAEDRDRRDLADIRRVLDRYACSLDEVHCAEVQALPRIQKDEAMRAAHAGLALAVRLGMEALVLYGYEVPVLAPEDDEE